MAANLYEGEICEGAPPSAGDTQKKGRLTIQCDELWSFVDNQGNKQWVWLALDVDTREMVGVYIGARDEVAARKLWESLPPVYRQCAVAYTDFWADYGAVLPSKRHRAVGKETGKTSYIERFNHTLRQRVSGLSEKPCPSLNRWKITLVPFGISFITTMHHYLCSTTNSSTLLMCRKNNKMQPNYKKQRML
jgi:insertion element IS1 protein InsB